jgi:ADP-ribose pyrophosphatase
VKWAGTQRLAFEKNLSAQRRENVAWRILDEKPIKTTRFEIIEQTVQLPNDEQLHFSYVKMKAGVCILAIDSNGSVLVLKQYRHAMGEWEWELPAGMVEEGEDPLETAKRELIEETGFEAQSWEGLGFFHPSAGSTTERIYLFAATDLVKREQNLESSEFLHVTAMPLEGLHNLVSNGEFNHGAGLAAILRFSLKSQFWKQENRPHD